MKEEEDVLPLYKRMDLYLMRFKNLQNFLLYLTPSRNLNNDWKHLSSIYDWSASSNNVLFHTWAFSPETDSNPDLPLTFPHAKKVTLRDEVDLLHLNLPSLRYLSFPIAQVFRYDPIQTWLDLADSLPIPFHNLDTLELTEWSTGDSARPIDIAFLKPFQKVQTLVINDILDWLPDGYLLPLPWTPIENPTLPPPLPLLNTLFIVLCEELTERRAYRVVLKQVRKFVEIRRDMGYPLRVLQLNFIPRSVMDEDIEWLRKELDKVEVVEYVDDFESVMRLFES